MRAFTAHVPTGHIARHHFAWSQVAASHPPGGVTAQGLAESWGCGVAHPQPPAGTSSWGKAPSPSPPRCATNSLSHPAEAGGSPLLGWGERRSTCPGGTSHGAATEPSVRLDQHLLRRFAATLLGFRHGQVNDEGKGKYYYYYYCYYYYSLFLTFQIKPRCVVNRSSLLRSAQPVPAKVYV